MLYEICLHHSLYVLTYNASRNVFLVIIISIELVTYLGNIILAMTSSNYVKTMFSKWLELFEIINVDILKWIIQFILCSI